MKNLNLNQFMHDVHQNAIAHGWWDQERSIRTIRALFHEELSEALRAYRNHEAMVWHQCPVDHKPCENQPIHDMENLPCITCSPTIRKPEGIAVELMDFVIRIMDYLGRIEHVFAFDMCTPETLAAWSLDDFQMDDEGSVLDLDLPEFVDILHTEVALSDVMHSTTYLVTAAGLAIKWVAEKGLDPAAIMREKHKYNKTRPYKHGGKEC